MKIGILTFHRAHNYGAVLQCYALQEVLKAKGHYVEIIDYRQSFIESLYKVQYHKRYIVKCCLHFQFLSLYNLYKDIIRPQLLRRENFESFRKKYFKTTNKVLDDNFPNEFDAYVLGSDQLWSFYCTKKYEKVYWGDFVRNKNSRLIGYAISSVGDFSQYLSDKMVLDNLKRFDSLSVRETEIKDYFKNKYNFEVPVTIDPTLLTTKDTWKPLLNNKWCSERYVVVYELRILSGENFVLKRAQEYASMRDLKLINLSDMSYGVDDFVSIISSAEAVFTSSFHAVVFSLIFKTPFWAFDLGDGKEIRYTNLLKLLGLQEHIVNKLSCLGEIPVLDASKIDANLESLRKESIQFLDDSLQ